MTDKQIIIDGVDVSKCKYHDRGWCLLSESYVDREHIRYRPCGDMTFFDCYYKNWKRKEQKCDELNKWLPIVTRLEEQFKSYEKAKSIGYKTYAEQVFTELDQLKAENEELKNFHINLVGVKECEIRKLVKYKQALRDIIEIAKPQTHYINIKQNKTASEVEYDYANIVWNLEQRMYKILQKCEVLDE